MKISFNLILYVTIFVLIIINVFMYNTQSKFEKKFLLMLTEAEIKNNLRKENLLKILDSLDKKSTKIDFDLEIVKKNNENLKKELEYYKIQYQKQQKIIADLKTKNNEIKINIPDNIDNLWK